MRDSATGRAAIRAYDLEIVKVLKDRFLIHDFAQIMTVYGSVKFVPEEGAELFFGGEHIYRSRPHNETRPSHPEMPNRLDL
jgi:hypothetical protein